jgi:hypothetical protein
MPRIKRWFPVSHDLNRDPEVWEMRKTLGEKSLSIWLEILSIADRNEGLIIGEEKHIAGVLAAACQTHSGYSVKVLRWVSERWLTVQRPVSDGSAEHGRTVYRVSNYWKYHRTGEQNKFPPDPTEPDRTIRDSSYKNTQNPKSPSATASPGFKNEEKKTREERLMASMNLIPELKKETDRLYNSDPVKFKRLAAWVAQGRKHGYLETDMAAALREFWDYRHIDEWYPYLDTVLEKVVKDVSSKTATQAHEREKAELAEWGRNARNGSGAVLGLVGGVANAKKA